MFKKILVANRGEIALRIMRTCREMNIATVAVFSDIDRKSPFVCFADEAYPIEGVTSQETYLNQKKILEIAQQSGSQAIHPGYGFLAENADFAQTVQKAGLTFIGPGADSIRLMGNKTAARQLMQEHGVPTVPGTLEPVTDKEKASDIARQIGYPVLIKASAGGGGKGMRLIQNEDNFFDGLESAAREAQAAFGDSSVYIEKFVEEPRHIEFQILADSKGHTIHLGERECSIQRRHQKIIEESPSALLESKLRQKMGEAAITAARACNYRNAGTIEFLVDKHRNFYFLEMNTRLQVEHPVTEMVTGQDLVREQIQIAAGLDMTLSQSVSQFWGHALECRLYAENPENAFTPSPGKILYLKPADGPGIREDSGVMQGSEISLYYDPMISKLVAWGKDRPHAIQRMIRALREYEITGIHTTIPFLIRVLEHPKFRAGTFTTKFIEEYGNDLFIQNKERAAIAALASVIQQVHEKNQLKLGANHRQHSPNNSRWKQIKRVSNLRE